MLKIFLLLISSISFSAPKFSYESYDSQKKISCTHKAVSSENPYDLTVQCEDKKFSVHLMVNKYTHPTPPRVSFELLYWVNNEGATTWFHLKDETDLMEIESSQSVESGIAGLRLKLKLL